MEFYYPTRVYHFFSRISLQEIADIINIFLFHILILIVNIITDKKIFVYCEIRSHFYL